MIEKIDRAACHSDGENKTFIDTVIEIHNKLDEIVECVNEILKGKDNERQTNTETE